MMQWISVSKPPSKDGDYLVCFGFVFIASFNSTNQKWYPKYGQAGLENRITHWMELPVPPRD